MKHPLIINSNGKAGKKRVVFPRFEIYSNPTIKISDIKRAPIHKLIIGSDGKAKIRKNRRFQVIDRTVQKARYEIMRREDEAIFRALDECLVDSGNKKE